jgi:hypothetical protein
LSKTPQFFVFEVDVGVDRGRERATLVSIATRGSCPALLVLSIYLLFSGSSFNKELGSDFPK